MTRQYWAVITFGLGVAVAPLVHQLGSACLHPAAAVAQEQLESSALQPTPDNKTRNQTPKPGDELPGTSPKSDHSAETFLELAKQKAALLSPEEMVREVESLRKELTELRATVQLREAVGKLKQLVGEHPQTQAAQRAKKMLETEAVPNRRNNHFDEFTPNLEPFQTTSPRKI